MGFLCLEVDLALHPRAAVGVNLGHGKVPQISGDVGGQNLKCATPDDVWNEVGHVARVDSVLGHLHSLEFVPVNHDALVEPPPLVGAQMTSAVAHWPRYTLRESQPLRSKARCPRPRPKPRQATSPTPQQRE